MDYQKFFRNFLSFFTQEMRDQGLTHFMGHTEKKFP